MRSLEIAFDVEVGASAVGGAHGVQAAGVRLHRERAHLVADEVLAAAVRPGAVVDLAVLRGERPGRTRPWRRVLRQARPPDLAGRAVRRPLGTDRADAA